MQIWLRMPIWKDSVEASLHSLIVWPIDGIKEKINLINKLKDPLFFWGPLELSTRPLGVHGPDFENHGKIRSNICYLCHFLQWKLPWSCSPHQPPRLGSPPGLTGRWAVAACTHGTPALPPCPPPACSAPRPARTGRRGAAETGETKHIYSERCGSMAETVKSKNNFELFLDTFIIQQSRLLSKRHKVKELHWNIHRTFCDSRGKLPGPWCSWALRGSRGSVTAESRAVADSLRGSWDPACKIDTPPPRSSCSPPPRCSGSAPAEHNKV